MKNVKVSIEISDAQPPIVHASSSCFELNTKWNFIKSFTKNELEVFASHHISPCAIPALGVRSADASLNYKEFYLELIPKLQKIGMSAYDDAPEKDDKKDRIKKEAENISDHIEEFKGISIPKRRVSLGDREQAIAFALMLASEFGKE
jgi:hypothetical protein